VGLEFESVTGAISGRDAHTMIETSVHGILIPAMPRAGADPHDGLSNRGG
jgi:hypothetical protein